MIYHSKIILFGLFLVLSLAVLSPIVLAEAPAGGGFMTGPDSSLYVYWFYPHLHVKTINTPVVSGVGFYASHEAGDYAVFQSIHIPPMSLLDRVNIRIEPYDAYPAYPGDQYSPFDYMICADNGHNQPSFPALIEGENNRSDSIIDFENRVPTPVTFDNPAGAPLWFGMKWKHDTPSAPIIIAGLNTAPDCTNYYAIGNGGEYDLRLYDYAFAFDYDMLSCFAPEEGANSGVNRFDIADAMPDSFSVMIWRNGFLASDTRSFTGTDTLMYRLPDRDVDSVALAVCHGDSIAEEPLVLVFDRHRCLPIDCRIYNQDHDVEGHSYSYDIELENESEQDITLDIGTTIPGATWSYNSASMWPGEIRSFPIVVPDTGLIAGRYFVIIQDRYHEYLPHLAFFDYPPQEPTDVTGDNSIEYRGDVFRIYPNPSSRGVYFHSANRISAGQVTVYNILGQKVYSTSLKGSGDVYWDGRDSEKRIVPQGIYLVTYDVTKSPVEVKKVIIKQ